MSLQGPGLSADGREIRLVLAIRFRITGYDSIYNKYTWLSIYDF